MLIGLVVLFGCGAAVDVCGCYNIGLIDGYGDKWSKPLSSPVGGIIGYLSDNSTWLGVDDKQITTKYLQFTFEIKTLGLHNFTNKLSYCYNSGTLNGDYLYAVDFDHYNGGIVGFIGWGFGSYSSVLKWMAAIITRDADEHHTQVIDCYYRITEKTSTGTNNLLGNDKATGFPEDKLKKQLYKWFNSLTIPEGEEKGTYIYNTTAPVETSLGFDGYGILWWQLEGYGRTTFHVYDNVGVPIYKDITLHIGDSTVNLENYSKLNCSRGIETYGYILMLNKSNEYKSKAKNSKYIDDANQEIKVNIGHENDVYIGKRPEFILAINNNNTNNNNITRTENIPAGDYYIIACGGRRLFRSYTC